MNRLSVSTQAAISALPALLAATEPVRHYRVAQDYQVSRRAVQDAFTVLSRAGILTGKRGPHGGYNLAKPPGEITLLAVVEAMEGPLDYLDGEALDLMTQINHLLGAQCWTAWRHTTLDDVRRGLAGKEIP
jgi:Rrf2 family protein